MPLWHEAVASGQAMHIGAALATAAPDFAELPFASQRPIPTFGDLPTQLHYFEPDEGEPQNAGAIAQAAKVGPWLQSRVPS